MFFCITRFILGSTIRYVRWHHCLGSPIRYVRWHHCLGSPIRYVRWHHCLGSPIRYVRWHHCLGSPIRYVRWHHCLGSPIRYVRWHHCFFFVFCFVLFMHFCPGTITTHAESINSDLQRGLDRRLRHIRHWTQNRTSEPLKYQRTTNTTATLVVKHW